MFDFLISSLLIAFAYVLGSFATGYHLVWWKTKRDIRCHGSGSIGATNVSRVMGKFGFFTTLVIDCLKAILAVGICQILQQSDMVISMALIAVIAGHIWPFYLNFKGGKGIAVALGAFLMVDIYIVVFIVSVSALVFQITRRFTLSWLLGVIALLISIVVKDNQSLSVIFSVFFSSTLIIYAHRDNILDEFFFE